MDQSHNFRAVHTRIVQFTLHPIEGFFNQRVPLFKVDGKYLNPTNTAGLIGKAGLWLSTVSTLPC